LHAAVAGSQINQRLNVTKGVLLLRSVDKLNKYLLGWLLGRFLDRRYRLGLGLRGKDLGGAADEHTVLLEALDQPVIGAVASNAALDTGETEIEVVVIALGAVVVGIGDGSLAAVAADSIFQSRARVGANGRGHATKVRIRHNRAVGLVNGGVLEISKVSRDTLRIPSGNAVPQPYLFLRRVVSDTKRDIFKCGHRLNRFDNGLLLHNRSGLFDRRLDGLRSRLIDRRIFLDLVGLGRLNRSNSDL